MMGTATNLMVRTIRSTGRGSDHFGACDQCGKHCSEHFATSVSRVYQLPDGRYYLSTISGGAYGHESCLIKQFGDAISAESLSFERNLLMVPAWAVEKYGVPVGTA